MTYWIAKSEVDKLENKIKDLKASHARELEEIMYYADHSLDCNMKIYPQDYQFYRCTCGFSKHLSTKIDKDTH